MKKNFKDPFTSFIGHLSETTSHDGIKPSMREEKATALTPEEQKALQSFGNGGVIGAISNSATQITRKVMTAAMAAQTPTVKIVSEATAQLVATIAGTATDHCQNNPGKESISPQQYDPNARALAVVSGAVTTALQIAAGRRGVGPVGQVLLSTAASGLTKVIDQVIQSQAEKKPRDISQESAQDTLGPAQPTLRQKTITSSATNMLRLATAATRTLSPNSPLLTAAFIAASGASGGIRHAAITQRDSAPEEDKPKVSHTGPKR